MERFGEKLRTLRNRRGWSIRRLGKELGVYYSFVTRMETGEKTPNAAMLIKIAKIFEVSLDTLMLDDLELDVGEDEEE